MVPLKDRQFSMELYASDDRVEQGIEALKNGALSLLIIREAQPTLLENYAELLPQDLYGSTVVPIGADDNSQDHVWSTKEMLWHMDRSYSADIHPFVGLFCKEAEPGSSPTLFCDMQRAYSLSPEELKTKASNESALHSVAHYFSQMDFPHHFRSEAYRRAFRAKAKAIHPLVKEDSYGPYFFFSPAYAETELTEELFHWCYRPENIYIHHWLPGDLLIYSNLKLTHKRDDTLPSVRRRHLRFGMRL